MTIDEDDLYDATFQRVEEAVLELVDDERFIKGVLEEADQNDTEARRNTIRKFIREAAGNLV